MKLGRAGLGLVWLLGVGLGVVVLVRANFTADLTAFLPGEPTPRQRLLIDQLREGAATRLILIGIEGADASIRSRLSRALAEQLRHDGAFRSVNNGRSAHRDRDREFLFRHRYLLSSAVNRERFSADGLRLAIAHSLDGLASSAGLVLQSLLTRDPTGELLTVLEPIEPRDPPRTVDGIWVSRDGQRALLMAETRASGADTDGQEQAMGRIRTAFCRALESLDAAATGIRLRMTGPGVFSVESRELIRGEAVWLSLLSTGIVVTLLLAVYRSLTALVLGLLPVASGALAGVAAVGLGFGTIHGITLGFGVSLIGEAVDYAIYRFVLVDGMTGIPGDGAGAEWLDRYWPTVRLGVATSVCGALPLFLSGFPGFSQLGLYSMVGLVVAATVTRWVLPAFLPADFRIRDVTPHGEVLQGLIERTRPLRWGIVVFLGVAAVVLWVRREVLWNEDLGALSPVPVHDLELDATMRADLGAPDVRHVVVVQAPDRESALIAAEQVSARLAALVGDGVLGGFQSPSLYLPSIRTQLARRESLPADGELRRRFAAAAKTLPLRPDRFEPFFADVRVARESRPLQLEDLEGTSFGVVTRSLLQERAGRWTAVLLLTPPRRGPNPGTIDIAKVNHALAPPPVGDKVLLDLKEESDRLYRDYLQEAIRLSLGGVVAIALVLVVALRSPTRVLRTSLPLFSSLILVTATVVLCGRQLTMLHLIGMMLTVAIGSNYCLFFDRLRYRDDSNPIPAPRMLVSLTLANLTTVSVFGLLALSEVPVLNAIGSMVAPGTFLALLVSAWFVPLRSDADRVVEVGR